MKIPYFSVIIPAYNVGPYIRETIESVLCQTEQDFELIVINDGSTDDTAEQLGFIQNARLFVYHIENHGVSYARNMGVSVARGKFLAFIDGDDVWAPSHLQQAAEFFDQNSDVAWWTSMSYVGSTPRKDNANRNIASEVMSYHGLPAFYANSSTLVLRAEEVKALMPLFPEEMCWSEDWAAWVSYAEKHPQIAFCSVEDVLYRIRPGSATQSHSFSNLLMERYMAFAHHMHMISKQRCGCVQRELYFRYRTLERWLLFLQDMGLPDVNAELRMQKSLLGVPMYIFLRFIVFFYGRIHMLVCRMLRIVYYRMERRVKAQK